MMKKATSAVSTKKARKPDVPKYPPSTKLKPQAKPTRKKRAMEYHGFEYDENTGKIVILLRDATAGSMEAIALCFADPEQYHELADILQHEGSKGE